LPVISVLEAHGRRLDRRHVAARQRSTGTETLTLTIPDGGFGDADGATNGRISDPGGVAAVVGAAEVPFAAFGVKLEVGREEGGFEPKGVLTVASTSRSPRAGRGSRW
jgi:hypothetical protein